MSLKEDKPRFKELQSSATPTNVNVLSFTKRNTCPSRFWFSPTMMLRPVFWTLVSLSDSTCCCGSQCPLF